MLLTSTWNLSILLIFIALYVLYKYFTRNFNYWEKRGIFYIKPLPFFGNFFDTFTFKSTIAHGLKAIYDQSKGDFVGAFVFDTPVLILRSPKLIEHVLIKDFSFFKDRSLASPKHNPIVANWLLFQGYSDWKKTRPKVTSIFSSGKIKGMFYTAKPIIDDMYAFITNKDVVIEVKDLSRRYSTEVVSRCYFGMGGRCFEKGNSEIQNIATRLFEFSARNAIIQGLHVFKPQWVELFKLDFMKRSDQDYMLDAFMDVVNERKKVKAQDGKAFDYIDIILETQESTNNDNKIGMTEVMSNTLQFFIAGTETMSSVQSFCLYELAIHPEIQDKARKEVNVVVKRHGALTYEAIHDMGYVHFCVLETLRKYVSLQIIDRKAVEDYRIPDTDIIIEKGTIIYIPFYAVHQDEKYYPDPTRYNPDRFFNKSNVEGINFLPFGAGPRACIGERFGMIISKLFVASILLEYMIEPCETTPIPVELETRSFVFQSKTGLPLTLKPITDVR
ncbi:cytochrome P450 6k1-like [Diabrotica virgifera virgifera]|uniref:Cytochrome P450 6k1-like n=1 Tax=Diabrotica virgifera virgifera TaxID=50390 RepID=A0ABM5KUQ8_DIAVI|nr:cytochrome P450 6k1-like [Diabrotica virgifera virgifera]XP_050513924.1 cytochrome P450 6k1-like [Diabrotica virgifera virgifera]XP_050513925.1 cytochrome P450 6k1-like [Diabrotica virgifera virgifera]XP_050513926.1 cytochrome P450 6k1-like [Diabrotica virgifera virgifera]